jgi:uncharacterized protein (DUF1697 family)
MPPRADRYVALLRGINAGAHRRMAMPDLRSLAEDLGFTDVATHVQSGNLVFGSAMRGAVATRPDRLARQLEGGLVERFGFEVDVVVRSRAEIEAVLALNPFGEIATDLARYSVTFLSAPPDAERLARVDAATYLPEQFHVEGREVYLWLPDGMQSSRLATPLSKVGGPGVIATNRNWRTVEAVAAFLAD